MKMSFVSTVETFAIDHGDVCVTFSSKPGRYRVHKVPEDVALTLRRAQQQGGLVRIVYESDSFEITDALPV